jgi:hypothetical protein
MNYPYKLISLGDAYEKAFQAIHGAEGLEERLFERWTTARQEAVDKGVALTDLDRYPDDSWASYLDRPRAPADNVVAIRRANT